MGHAIQEATTGCARNPYADLADGCYPTTADEYLSFYRFIGEYAGTGKMIRQRCEKNDMHVIKSNGYYGFFLVGENGTSIVNGGKTKRVSTHRDIKWAHDNFDTVVSKYSPRSRRCARGRSRSLASLSDSVSRGTSTASSWT